MSDHYILDKDNNPVPCDLMTWAQAGHKRVAESTWRHLWVSTVFMGLDHRFGGEGPPILFETMVFYRRRGRGDSTSDLYCRRACTWDEALQCHKEALNLCKTGQITRGMKARPTTRKAMKRIKKWLAKKDKER